MGHLKILHVATSFMSIFFISTAQNYKTDPNFMFGKKNPTYATSPLPIFNVIHYTSKNG